MAGWRCRDCAAAAGLERVAFAACNPSSPISAGAENGRAIKMIRGLNHITLAVSNLEDSVAFYRHALGLKLERQWSGGAYLTAGELWLCLSPDPAVRRSPHADYTHVALDVASEDFAAAAERIRAAGTPIWKDNRSEGESLYFLDPDGHKLELHVGSLRSRLAAMGSTGD